MDRERTLTEPTAPTLDHTQQAVRQQAADAIASQADQIQTRWIERLEATLYAGRPDLGLAEIRDEVPQLVRGVAHALSQGELEALEAPWTKAARDHALQRLAQNIRLGSLVREYLALREEIRRALQPLVASLTPDEVQRLDGDLDSILNTVISVGANAYASELRRMAERLALLQQATAAFAVAQTPLQIADAIITKGLSAMGASAGLVALLSQDGQFLDVVQQVGAVPTPAPDAHRIPVNAPIPAAEAVRTGQAVWLGSPDELQFHSPSLFQTATKPGLHAWAAIPLASAGRVIGVVGLGFERPQAFSTDDREFALSLVRLSAQAIERSELQEAAQRERVAAEQAQRRYESVLESMTDGFLILDRQGRIVYINPRGESISQVKRSEAIGHNIWEVFPESAQFAPVYERAMVERTPVGFDALYVRRGIWVEVHAYPSPEGLSVFYTDITARKEAENALRESEERFRTVFDEGPMGIGLVSLDLRFMRTNPRLAQMLGYTPQEMDGRAVADFVYPDDVSIDASQVQRLSKNEIPLYTIEKRHLHKGGGIVWLGITATLICDVESRPLYYLTMVQDIDERKRAEAALGESERRFHATFEQAAVGMAILDMNGRFENANQKLCDITGYTPEELKALTFLDISFPEDAATDMANVRRLLSGEVDHYTTEKRDRRKDGSAVWVNLSVSLVRNAAGEPEHFMAVVEDIEARKRAEVERERLEEQREDILRAVSHDLRNPLAAVQGQAQLLRRALDLAGQDGREHANVEAILGSTQRMNIMIQDLVDVARSETGQLELKLQPLDLPSFVNDLKARQAIALEMQRIQVQPPDHVPAVLADPDRLERILVNLLSNALKYSAPGTPVEVSFAAGKGEVVTSIADHGPGIPPEELARLFQRYRRAAPAAGRPESVGLGLYITRQLVEAHHGRVWATSVVGQGSVFSFTLPTAQEPASP